MQLWKWQLHARSYASSTFAMGRIMMGYLIMLFQGIIQPNTINGKKSVSTYTKLQMWYTVIIFFYRCQSPSSSPTYTEWILHTPSHPNGSPANKIVSQDEISIWETGIEKTGETNWACINSIKCNQGVMWPVQCQTKPLQTFSRIKGVYITIYNYNCI